MKIDVPKEQIIYSEILYYGSVISIIILTALFLIYTTGFMPSYLDFQRITELWGEKHHKFVEETGIPTGWGWLKLINYADFMNLLFIAALAFLTIICYIAILPVFITKKDWIFAMITIAEIIVLLLAASGLITTGH
ncbi:MAG: hypothetical protein QXU61_04070 [Archaeoglobaceae archaeon]